MKKLLIILVGILFVFAIVTGAVKNTAFGQEQFSVVFNITCYHKDDNKLYSGLLDANNQTDIKSIEVMIMAENSLLCDKAIPKCEEDARCEYYESTRSETGTGTDNITSKSYRELLNTYGLACKRKYAECENGFINFLQNTESGEFELNGNLSLAQMVLIQQNTKANQACVAEDKLGSDVIPVYVEIDGNVQVGDDATLGKSLQKEIGLQQRNDLIVPRVCPKGSLAMQSYYGESRFWGCCPSNYEFVNEFSTGKGNAKWQTYSGCCPKINGSVLSGFDYNEDNITQTSCTYKNMLTGADTTITKSTFNSQQGQDIFTIESGMFILGQSIDPNFTGYNSNSNSDVARNAPQAIKSEFVCPDKEETGADTSCAVAKSTNNVSIQTKLDNSSKGNLSVFRPENFNEISGLECISCFTAGSPIAITEGKLLTCNQDGTMKENDLINNSVNDTLVYLRTDIENRDALQACRERGGIYIFVGCVDPTPLGVITGLIRITLGVVGGVALLQLIWIGILLQSGQEKQIAAARKNLMATLTGVAVLVFSILILRIIGVNVLDILPAGSV